MKLIATQIAGVMVAETTRISDHRGSFARLFCGNELNPVFANRQIVQINHSCTCQLGTIRGMHFQNPPRAEMKLVRCLKGSVWDVAVDLRQGSTTFLQWHAQELTPENGLMMIIPEGCAHGFQALEQDSELLYLHTSWYAPELEAGVRYDDPALGIQWPMPVSDISDRDKGYQFIDKDFSGVML